jgi:hypothetical protein
MTDIDKLANLLTEFGIGIIREDNLIMCEQGQTKVDGYSGFFAVFNFDDNGKFINMIVGE